MVATPTSILSTDGRITIPVAIRRALNLVPGDRIHVVQIDAGRLEIVPANRPVTELKGLLGKHTKTGSIAKIRLRPLPAATPPLVPPAPAYPGRPPKNQTKT